jgi:hypothetical protein
MIDVVIVKLPQRYAARRKQGSTETSNITLNRYLTIHYKQECAYVCLLFIRFHIDEPVLTKSSMMTVGFGWL